MCKAKLSKRIGLSLYEMLAIVVIIGIIALIAVPAVDTTITRSTGAVDAVTEQQIIAAATRFAADTKLHETATIPVATLVAKGYLSAVPRWHKAGNYKSNATIKVDNSTGTVTVTLN